MADSEDLQARNPDDVLGEVQEALIEIRELLTAAGAVCVQHHTQWPKVSPAMASLSIASIGRVLKLADAAIDRAWSAADCVLDASPHSVS